MDGERADNETCRYRKRIETGSFSVQSYMLVQTIQQHGGLSTASYMTLQVPLLSLREESCKRFHANSVQDTSFLPHRIRLLPHL